MGDSCTSRFASRDVTIYMNMNMNTCETFFIPPIFKVSFSHLSFFPLFIASRFFCIPSSRSAYYLSRTGFSRGKDTYIHTYIYFSMSTPALLTYLQDLPALQPPPEVKANLAHPESKGYILVFVSSVLLVLMLGCFCARGYARFVFVGKRTVWGDCECDFFSFVDRGGWLQDEFG